MKWITFCSLSIAIGTGVLLWQDDLIPILNVAPIQAVTEKDSLHADERLIFAAGETEGAQREVALNFEIEGRLKAIAFAEGQRVRKNDVLAQLDDPLLSFRLAQAKADRDLAQAERERLVNGASTEARDLAKAEALLANSHVEQIEAQYRRALSAFKRKAISDQEYEDVHYKLKIARAEFDRAKAHVAEVEAKARTDELKMAEARVQLARAKVDHAQAMVDKSVLRAPTDGVVLRVNAEPGELVGATRQTPIVNFVDDGVLRVRAFIEELDALQLRRGQRAWAVADGKPNVRHHGTIIWIAPSMQAKSRLHHKPGERVDTRVREVLIELDDPGSLFIGVPVDVFIDPSSGLDEETPPAEKSRSDSPSNRHSPPRA